MPSTVSPSQHAGYDGPFDDCSFVRLASSGQIDNLRDLLDTEEHKYAFRRADCDGFRAALDVAAGPPSIGGGSATNDWRYRIARWMLRASDEFSISRETATIAISYCDRYMLKQKITRHLYQVVAITCLLVATKLFEKGRIKMAALMQYTQGRFDKNEILSTERELVASIGSFLYPPKAGTFLLLLLKDFSGSASLSGVIESCQFMIELATCDFFFVAHKQSRLAVAAILVTLEQMHGKLPPVTVQSCLANIESAIHFSDDLGCMACVKQLRAIYTQNETRIKAIDIGNCSVATSTSDEENSRKRICRAATPSPTPEDQQPELARFSEAAPGADGSPRKRQRMNVAVG